MKWEEDSERFDSSWMKRSEGRWQRKEHADEATPSLQDMCVSCMLLSCLGHVCAFLVTLYLGCPSQDTFVDSLAVIVAEPLVIDGQLHFSTFIKLHATCLLLSLSRGR